MTTDQGITGGAELDLNTSVTPTNQSLNPNANIFQSKLPHLSTTDNSEAWDLDANESATSQTTLTSSTDTYQYLNGDINKLRSRTVFPSTPSPCTDLPVVVMSSDYAANGLSATASSTASLAPMAYPAATSVPSPTLPVDGIGDAIALNEEPVTGDGAVALDQLKAMLTQQLEYYFSRENLANDTYLLSQMDSDQYVPIWTVANFNQIKKLTKDLGLIVEVLRESSNVQVDDAGEKVRPNHKRCIVILREIAESTPVEEVEALFKGENCPKFVSCEFAHNNSWYVTFDSDEDAQKAYRYLREEVKTFQGKSIMARIKAKPITRTTYIPKNGYRTTVDSNVYQQQTQQQQPQHQQQQPQHQQQQPQQRFMTYPTHVPSIGYNSQQVPVYAFPPFYPPSVLQTWGPANSAYCDIGSVFSINGLAPQAAFKPNGPNRHSFTARASSRHRRRKKDDEPATVRGRPELTKSSVATKEPKILPKFDLEASSFPPLPGTADPSSIEGEVFENRMSDVVKGTAKPLTRDTKTQTSAPLSPVSSTTTNESCVLTNGDAFTSPFAPSSPPPSPTISRCRTISMADKATKTDEFLSSVDDQGSPITVPAASRVLECRHSPSLPLTRLQTTAVGTADSAVGAQTPQATAESAVSTRKPPTNSTHPTANVLNNSAAATAKPVAVTSNSFSDSMPKLSYAQMAQRAKEKVEKIAQEQKEKQEVQERERRIREREMATVTTTIPKSNGGSRNAPLKEGRLPRDSTKGQRDKFVSERDRFPRKIRTLKEIDFREERDRRKERDVMMRPKSPK